MLGALAPLPRETSRLEWLDRADMPQHELAECLGDIARLNRLGATRALLRALAPFFQQAPAGRPLRVLDLGTGGADIPAALVRWARARRRSVSVLAVDLHPPVLACAAARARELPEVRLVAGDALRPPVRPGGADVTICSLTLHHLPPEGVAALLRLMAETSRLGFVVSDLRRSRAAYVAAWLATHAISRNRATRHDGPLSVRRAYTPAELGRLAAAAGLPGIRWRRAAPFRVLGIHQAVEAARPGQPAAERPRLAGRPGPPRSRVPPARTAGRVS